MSAGTFRMRREAAERAALEAAAKEAQATEAIEEPAKEAQEEVDSTSAATVTKAKPRVASRPA